MFSRMVTGYSPEGGQGGEGWVGGGREYGGRSSRYILIVYVVMNQSKEF